MWAHEWCIPHSAGIQPLRSPLLARSFCRRQASPVQTIHTLEKYTSSNSSTTLSTSLFTPHWPACQPQWVIPAVRSLPCPTGGQDPPAPHAEPDQAGSGEKPCIDVTDAKPGVTIVTKGLSFPEDGSRFVNRVECEHKMISPLQDRWNTFTAILERLWRSETDLSKMRRMYL